MAPLAWGQHDPAMHRMEHGQPTQAQPMPMPQGGLPPDTRELVHFPAPLREHTLASMRDHLLTLQRI